MNKRFLKVALCIGLVVVLGIYFLSNNFANAGEYESLDGIVSETNHKISKKGVATIIGTL
ncbi:hypothetical protein B795N_16850 [Marinilactibacillus psychrotolerans]|uniref:hypothetical protein n=1 Tax=Marinilactibacillus psychrotolerans TaxID=191770 RepID=UPI001C7CCE66|nr:hypothetical protein [Marinilactibacillus psychrotolerans]GEQ33803.1 hypothetical protein B795N_16850 [Marinilactibacillus psychrotolerans]